MDDLWERVQAVVADYMDVDILSIKEDTDLINGLKIDKVELIALSLAIEEEFDIEMLDTDLDTILTVGDIAKYVECLI